MDIVWNDFQCLFYHSTGRYYSLSYQDSVGKVFFGIICYPREYGKVIGFCLTIYRALFVAIANGSKSFTSFDFAFHDVYH
jgi:hypothetical protein